VRGLFLYLNQLQITSTTLHSNGIVLYYFYKKQDKNESVVKRFLVLFLAIIMIATICCACSPDDTSEIYIPTQGNIPEAIKISIVSDGEALDCYYINTKTEQFYSEIPEYVTNGDLVLCGDYAYTYNESIDGWWVHLACQSFEYGHFKICKFVPNYNFVTTNETAYGEILASIGNKQTKMLQGTFMGCANLSVAPTIPDGVTDMIGTFNGCSSLTVAPSIPSGVTDMRQTFRGCANLTKAPVIPNGVTLMSSTFQECTNLIEPPIIPDGVTDMCSTFEGCTIMRNAPTIPSSVECMERTFMNCKWIECAPAIPDSVTQMANAFNGCVGLMVAPTIPSGVNNMHGLFYGCAKLAGTIEINATPDIYGHCFGETTQSIMLTGTSTILPELAETATNDNVTVQ
jgi:hypothetical protein